MVVSERIDWCTSSEGANHSVSAELSPCLEDEFEVVGVVVYVVIREQDGLSLVFGIRPELLVETVALRLSVPNGNAVLGNVILWGVVFEVVPDDDYFEK